jgi:hypothetical protein
MFFVFVLEEPFSLQYKEDEYNQTSIKSSKQLHSFLSKVLLGFQSVEFYKLLDFYYQAYIN